MANFQLAHLPDCWRGSRCQQSEGLAIMISVQSDRPWCSERLSGWRCRRPQNGFVEVAEALTGFMRIKRDVFRQMMEKYPELN